MPRPGEPLGSYADFTFHFLWPLTLNSQYNLLADPCETEGCNAPYNTGCKVVDDKAECICPTCPVTVRPVCASDDVQDPSECILRRQACLTSTRISVNRRAACGMSQFIVRS